MYLAKQLNFSVILLNILDHVTQIHSKIIKETNLRKVLPANRVISVGQSVIQPVTVVRDLGVLTDGELSMRQHCDPVVTDMFLSSAPAAVSASTTRA